jgi:hypothetical protein
MTHNAATDQDMCEFPLRSRYAAHNTCILPYCPCEFRLLDRQTQSKHSPHNPRQQTVHGTLHALASFCNLCRNQQLQQASVRYRGERPRSTVIQGTHRAARPLSPQRIQLCGSLEPLRKGLMISCKLPAPPAQGVVWRRVQLKLATQVDFQ